MRSKIDISGDGAFGSLPINAKKRNSNTMANHSTGPPTYIELVVLATMVYFGVLLATSLTIAVISAYVDAALRFI